MSFQVGKKLILNPKKAVELVRPSSAFFAGQENCYMRFFCYLCCIILLCYAHAANADNPIPAVFNAIQKESTCVVVSSKKSPGGDKLKDFNSFEWIDPKLGQTIEVIKNGVQAEAADILKPLFHPRLKVSKGMIEEVLQKQKTLIGKPYLTNIDQVWAIYSKDRSVDKIQCVDDFMKISPLYGYEYQISLWISSTGERETGKIFVTLVPKDGNWLIGNFHWQQWTHKAKDFRNWVEEADQLFLSKNYLAAWIYYDLARKLVYGKTYFFHAGESLISDHQAKFAPGDAWKVDIAKLFPSEKISALNSILTKDGVGIAVRFGLEKELSAMDIGEHCKKNLKTLISQPWFNPVSGLKCGYTLPGEPTNKDGHLGSIYIDRTQQILR